LVEPLDALLQAAGLLFLREHFVQLHFEAPDTMHVEHKSLRWVSLEAVENFVGFLLALLDLALHACGEVD